MPPNASKIIAYAVIGAGEAQRYLRATFNEFKRLADHTVIVGNNISANERQMIAEYGFELIEDHREWGTSQHKIKQDLMYYLAKYEPKYLICLDGDEVFDPTLTKEKLIELLEQYNALYFYIVNLWNEGWNRQWSFWNIRAWKWNGDTRILNKPLHCGLAPEWCYYYASYVPYFVKHYGLMKEVDRQNKIERYRKYDPNGKYKDKSYYEALASNKYDILDEAYIRERLNLEVGKQKRKVMQETKPKRFFNVKTPLGKIIDVPERDLQETLSRKGFVLIGEIGK